MGRPAIIHKHPADLALRPKRADYATTCRAFSWDAARPEPAGRPGGGYYGRVRRSSGKIMRRLQKAHTLGLPEGHTLTAGA